MKKKIISLLLIAMICSTALISCGNNKSSTNSNTETSETQQESKEKISPSDNAKDSKITGENNKPTVEVKKIANISDFKDKDKSSIETLLGKPESEDNNKSVYSKDDYTFEITYLNSKCSEIKITPKIEMKFPADATNILNLVGINADASDSLSPAGMEWDNKYDTYKINVVSDNKPSGKISYVNIILTDPTK